MKAWTILVIFVGVMALAGFTIADQNEGTSPKTLQKPSANSTNVAGGDDNSVSGGRTLVGTIANVDESSNAVSINNIDPGSDSGADHDTHQSGTMTFTFTPQTLYNGAAHPNSGSGDSGSHPMKPSDLHAGDRVKLQVDQQNRILGITILESRYH